MQRTVDDGEVTSELRHCRPSSTGVCPQLVHMLLAPMPWHVRCPSECINTDNAYVGAQTLPRGEVPLVVYTAHGEVHSWLTFSGWSPSGCLVYRTCRDG
jgi:hypothetical protein